MPIQALCGGGPKGRLSTIVLRREDVPGDLSLPVEVWVTGFPTRGYGFLVDPEIIGDDLMFSLWLGENDSLPAN